MQVCEINSDSQYSESELVSVTIENGNYMLDLTRYSFHLQTMVSGLYLLIESYLGTFFAIPKPLKMKSIWEGTFSIHTGDHKINLGPRPTKKSYLYLYFSLLSKDGLLAVSDVFPLIVNQTGTVVSTQKQRKFSLTPETEIDKSAALSLAALSSAVLPPAALPVVLPPAALPPVALPFQVTEFLSIQGYISLTTDGKRCSWKQTLAEYLNIEDLAHVTEFLTLTNDAFIKHFISLLKSGRVNRDFIAERIAEWRTQLSQHPHAIELERLHEIWTGTLVKLEAVRQLRMKLNLTEPSIQYRRATTGRKSRTKKARQEQPDEEVLDPTQAGDDFISGEISRFESTRADEVSKHELTRIDERSSLTQAAANRIRHNENVALSPCVSSSLDPSPPCVSSRLDPVPRIIIDERFGSAYEPPEEPLHFFRERNKEAQKTQGE
jgi:hypothetical protein